MASTLAPSAPELLAPVRAKAFRLTPCCWPESLRLLFFAPLAFGATESWSVFVLEASTILLFALWVWRQSAEEEWRIRENPLFKPMALFGAVVIIQLIFGWTAYRHDTFSQALLYLTYGLLAFLDDSDFAQKFAGKEYRSGHHRLRSRPR